jgi:hypothetical protein
MKTLKLYYKFAGDLESRVYYTYGLLGILENLLAIDILLEIKDTMIYEAPKSLR